MFLDKTVPFQAVRFFDETLPLKKPFSIQSNSFSPIHRTQSAENDPSCRCCWGILWFYLKKTLPKFLLTRFNHLIFHISTAFKGGVFFFFGGGRGLAYIYLHMYIYICLSLYIYIYNMYIYIVCEPKIFKVGFEILALDQLMNSGGT